MLKITRNKLNFRINFVMFILKIACITMLFVKLNKNLFPTTLNTKLLHLFGLNIG